MRNFFFLIVLFFLSQWLLKKLRRANERAQQGDAQAGAGSASSGGFNGARRARNNGSGNGSAAGETPQLADSLIRCAQCGVHTPRSESIVVAGERFCCADHARAHANRPTGRDAR